LTDTLYLYILNKVIAVAAHLMDTRM